MKYDTKLKLFIGVVTKETYFKIFEKYFGRIRDVEVLSWDLTKTMVSEMFSHDLPAQDFTKTPAMVGFYGNDGVCLFKYFIRSADPQKSFVSTILVLNFICFAVITICYILIGMLSARSSKSVSSNQSSSQIRQRNRRMNQRISIIITTDFICWVPFIIICMLHYLEVVDATPWYSVFSMIILPINSVINPLLYNDVITRNIGILLSRTISRVSRVTETLISKIYPSTQSEPQEDIELQEVQGK
jgi:hypothetical protein